ncbi:MAG: GGDEF domain-containing protein [Spirulina sp. SIO3F2]|nr:GGDEF domain-containing protein [Spirulina sp. SIO3F2]
MIELDVLLIGAPEFIAAVEGRYGCFASKVIPVVSPADALPYIQQERPDIVILPFMIQVEQQIGRHLRQSNTSRSIYCLAVDVLDCHDLAYPLLMLTVERSAVALETGADAYFPMQLQVAPAIETEERLLMAYLQVANQQVSRYRELNKANDFLSTIALADPLTELGNRRALEWELPRQAQKARLRQTPLSLIILDVDYFKLVNDSHGHLMGDRVLKLLAARLNSQIRGRDTIFRYGGEEFVVLLSKTDLTAAEAIAGRLRLAIGEQPFSLNRGLSLPITVSLGVASFRASDDGKGRSLLYRADQHLLMAKSRGRNQVISDRSPEVGG